MIRKDNNTPSDLRFCIYRLTYLIRLRLAKAASSRQREPQRGLLASFAIALGILLCSPAFAHAPTKMIVIDQRASAINYAKGIYNKTQFDCLFNLYQGESKWNYKAHNPSGAWGIPQLKNDKIKSMSGAMQTMYGIKYINHRYSGNTCKALAHYRKYNWH